MKKNILITGGLGRIGSIIVPLLEQIFNVFVFESPCKRHSSHKNVIYGDITSKEDLSSALMNMDAVVHLAAISDEDDFIKKIMPVNIAGTYNLFEAVKNSSIKKVVFASTFQTIWNYSNNSLITTSMPARPSNMYACSKLFGESVARFYSEKFDISTVCLRIGYFLPYGHDWLNDTEKRRSWCSPKDLCQIIAKSILCENIKFEVFFAISENKNSFLDITNLKEKLNYESIDNEVVSTKNNNMYGATKDWFYNV